MLRRLWSLVRRERKAESTDSVTVASVVAEFLERSLVTEEEARVDEEAFSALRQELLAAMPDLEDVKLMGSLTRRTRLTRGLEPNADIDCLVIPNYQAWLEKYQNLVGPSFVPQWWAQYSKELRTALRRNPEFRDDDLWFAPPFLRLIRGDRYFDLTLAFRPPAPSGKLWPATDLSTADSDMQETTENYMLVGFASRADVEAMDKHVTNLGFFDGDETADPVSFILATDPFRLNLDVAWMDETYGRRWRRLIALWKSWNIKGNRKVRSHLIEQNVFNGLRDPTIFANEPQPISTLHFCAVFFKSRELYDHELFEREPVFVTFREALLEADSASPLDREAGGAALQKLFGL